jgi:hypothetical protein
MKILLSVGGIVTPLVSTELGEWISRIYSPMEWIYRILETFTTGFINIGIIHFKFIGYSLYVLNIMTNGDEIWGGGRTLFSDEMDLVNT